ncbi:MAG: hypothetical protein ACC645_15420, partial [Pirellulales bacterium]
MTRIARCLGWTAVLAAGLPAGIAGAASTDVAVTIVQIATVLGQVAQRDDVPKTRREADRLLAEARRAVDAGHFDQAEKLLALVDQSKVRYTLFHRDTPKRVRRDLEKARGKSSALRLPSTRFALPGTNSKTSDAKNDPFLTRAAATEAAFSAQSKAFDRQAGDSIRPSAKQGSPLLSSAPFGKRPIRSPDELTGSDESAISVTDGPGERRLRSGNDDLVETKKQNVLNLLKTARTAIARGDFDQATQLVQEAVDQRVPDSAYQKGDDRPWLVALKLYKARTGSDQAIGATAAGNGSPQNRAGDRIVLAQATEPVLTPAPET